MEDYANTYIPKAFTRPFPPLAEVSWPARLAQSYCQVSLIGIIPKKHRPGKWRLIVDLSSPEGGSVNDSINISKDTCSLSYVLH